MAFCDAAAETPAGFSLPERATGPTGIHLSTDWGRAIPRAG